MISLAIECKKIIFAKLKERKKYFFTKKLKHYNCNFTNKEIKQTLFSNKYWNITIVILQIKYVVILAFIIGFIFQQ